MSWVAMSGIVAHAAQNMASGLNRFKLKTGPPPETFPQEMKWSSGVELEHILEEVGVHHTVASRIAVQHSDIALQAYTRGFDAGQTQTKETECQENSQQ